jgi:hypothetical protein
MQPTHIKIIKSLKSKNSCGYDEMSVKILKVSSPFITAPLNYICNRSVLSGLFPTCLKYSVVIPLLKKGDKKDIKNYRPISLLTSFSTIFEKVIYIRLSKHIKNNDILFIDIYGFRNNSSTEKAMFKLLNDILLALNSKAYVGGIFCDLEKAFDSVNHDLLMKKLQFYGIVGNAYNLIQSYLSDSDNHILVFFLNGGRLNTGCHKDQCLDQCSFSFI